jgi:hypothetical protein
MCDQYLSTNKIHQGNMHLRCMKLEHIKVFMIYAYLLKQFVNEPCVNMENVSLQQNVSLYIK